MNVMLTCAGRRAYLVEYFREALEGCGRTIAVDADAAAPALGVADAWYRVPRIDDPTYIPAIVGLCRRESVDLLVSLNDLELPVLAAAGEQFARAGIRALVSSNGVIDASFDKFKTYRFASEQRIPVVDTIVSVGRAILMLRQGRLRYPVVVKPRWGSASVGITICNDEESLKAGAANALVLAKAAGLCDETIPEEDWLIVQPYMSGDEYGMDVLNDFGGRFVAVAGRRKLSMRAGETDRAITGLPDCVMGLGSRLGSALGHIGNLDCDVLVVDGKPYLLEMNPRFGGGYPFSHESGFNVVACYVAWAGGRDIDPSWLQSRSDMVLAKCDRLIHRGSREALFDV